MNLIIYGTTIYFTIFQRIEDHCLVSTLEPSFMMTAVFLCLVGDNPTTLALFMSLTLLDLV